MTDLEKLKAAHDAARAGDVINDHRLAQPLAQFSDHHSCGIVHSPSGRKWNYH